MVSLNGFKRLKMKQYALIIYLLLLSLSWTGCNQSSRNTTGDDTFSKAKLTDDQLLDTIQYYTFQYFYEGAESVSGMACERYHMDGDYPQRDKNVVTSGGSGFGIMALIVGMERGFISRDEGLTHFRKIMDFLENADRYHGVCPHWWNGETGKVKPFSPKDNGGDLVETAYLAQGLYAMRQYLRPEVPAEAEFKERIDVFVDAIEWNWHEQDSNVLYWHWSPEFEWEMALEIRGYNECLITYVMAASSREYAIQAETYHEGWARGGDMVGENEKYGVILPLNHNGSREYGGPLFWAHYSYLGLDPRNLSDDYTNYWKHNVNHARINYRYCVENPLRYKGYGENCWGLTASYSVDSRVLEADEKEQAELAQRYPIGYTGHSPARDKGVISPTAALASMPYTPTESLRAAHYFYEVLGDRLMGPYGLYDAFSLEYDWFPQRYLAIDQGPIVVMIENYRTGLLWKLFMQNPEVQEGLQRIGFKIDNQNNT